MDFLEDNLDRDMFENTSDIRIESTRDILSDAVSHIISNGPTVNSDNITELYHENSTKVWKGGKRGRKLGYRSENSNQENTLCGVCGAKVSRWL